MYPDCPYHAAWKPGTPAGTDAGGGMPGPSLLTQVTGGGDGEAVGVGDGDALGVTDGDAEGAGVGVCTAALRPASPPATTRAMPSVTPPDATPYTPGSTSTNANQPLPSAIFDRTGTPSICRVTRAPAVAVPRMWPSVGCVFHVIGGTAAVDAKTAGVVAS